SPNFGSGLISRFSALWRRDILFVFLQKVPTSEMAPVTVLFRTLRAVLGAALLAVLDALGVENAADDVVAHARKVLYAAATDHDDRVFLQVVAFARDVADDFEAIGQADLGVLTQSRVRLLRGRRVDAGANAALLGVFLQSRNLVALYRR